MRRQQLVYDGLWRCLCPAFDERALPRALNAAFPLRSVLSTPSQERPQDAKPAQRRRYGTINSSPSKKAQSLDSFFETVQNKTLMSNAKSNPLLKTASPNLENASTEDIVAALRVLQVPTKGGKIGQVPNLHMRIVHLVKFLVKKRDYPLDSFVYECMMHAMTDPKGSAKGVRKLLADMASENVPATAALCCSALEALTVHPDYVLRQEVVDMMHNYWHEVTVPAKQNIAVGMLREGQYELALAKLTELFESKQRVELWVYDVFIVEFGRAGFLDETLQLLKRRKHAKGTDDAFRSLLYNALDIFSQAFHGEGTAFAWDYAVKNSLHNPSHAVLENVMATAAGHGDDVLATEAFEIISSRGRVSQHHREALVDALANKGDVVGAFQALAAMEQSGARFGRGSTRSIYLAMKKNPTLIDEAASALSEMHKEGLVPLQAVTVTVEATAQLSETEAAMPLYHDTFFLTGKRPDYFMLRELIINSTEIETTHALAKDYNVMVPKDQRPRDALRVYDIMIPACAQLGDFDLAFELANTAMGAKPNTLEEGQDSHKLWRAAAWVEPLVDHTLQAEDARVWPIVDELDRGDDGPAQMVRVLLQRRRIQRRATDTRVSPKV
ncbi:hypothetical protein FZEAL_1694 [Fusarium zealandicum]|uniref:Pentatricopeptide repeat-containing protein-mitochondrial domain-containing protein n=1 Tax=Fusarium zealandicum TaxID=1053134 RepID=A0A8H4USZ6_9HYPO|nr:hypothetical protein FZEAL_1694 [Fusarium zealandicum]